MLSEFRDLKDTSCFNVLVRIRPRSPLLDLAARLIADFSIIAPGRVLNWLHGSTAPSELTGSLQCSEW
jgi:hypothetical protein